MSDGHARVEVVVRGRVQGVGFRYFVLRRATGLGLGGWVANQPDGTLRFVAEGKSEAVDELVEAVRQGPRGARVEAVDVNGLPPGGGFDGFDVRASGHRGD